MKNAVIRPFFEEPSQGTTLAPVIPIRSVRTEIKNLKVGGTKVVVDKTVPTFTQPIFKPKKHDMF